LVGEGLQSRDLVYVADVVAANRAAAQAKTGVAGEPVNIGRGERTTLRELLEKCAAALGVASPEPSFEAERPGDVRHSQADVSRAATLLGFRAGTALEAGLRDTVRWYAEGGR
jgi:nucleoside-diphosphate-sugar epimerase